MIPHHVYYQLAILGLLWRCVILHYFWPSCSALSPQPPAEPVPPTGKRQRADLRHRLHSSPSPCRRPIDSTPMCHRHLQALLPALMKWTRPYAARL